MFSNIPAKNQRRKKNTSCCPFILKNHKVLLWLWFLWLCVWCSPLHESWWNSTPIALIRQAVTGLTCLGIVQEELKEKKIKDEEQRRSNDKFFCMDKTPPDRLDLTESPWRNLDTMDHSCDLIMFVYFIFFLNWIPYKWFNSAFQELLGVMMSSSES